MVHCDLVKQKQTLNKFFYKALFFLLIVVHKDGNKKVFRARGECSSPHYAPAHVTRVWLFVHVYSRDRTAELREPA